jgi:hypothetical protein
MKAYLIIVAALLVMALIARMMLAEKNKRTDP